MQGNANGGRSMCSPAVDIPWQLREVRHADAPSSSGRRRNWANGPLEGAWQGAETSFVKGCRCAAAKPLRAVGRCNRRRSAGGELRVGQFDLGTEAYSGHAPHRQLSFGQVTSSDSNRQGRPLYVSSVNPPFRIRRRLQGARFRWSLLEALANLFEIIRAP